MRYLLAGLGGERSNNYFLDAAPSYLVAYATLVKISRAGDNFCGGLPLPIPNREVKPERADGTAKQCGRVGNRPLFFNETLE